MKSARGPFRFDGVSVLIESDVRDFIDTAAQRYGGLDVAFNNAGITIQKPLHEYTADEFDRVLNTNLRGTFLAMKYEVPHLIRSGGGTIVVTASSNALATDSSRAAYTASKRGLVGLVQSAALDYASYGIRVNALVPGTTDTDLVRNASPIGHLPDDAYQVAMKQWAQSNVPGIPLPHGRAAGHRRRKNRARLMLGSDELGASAKVPSTAFVSWRVAIPCGREISWEIVDFE
ncbi:SDR family NAD(P)-dependent oxidoreductase [Nocardia tengchongensis]|uniref:SDR family NAD(P)-dependent oxidoreductase n=1 Tax=Nocardia tengchongensis TaxID=2055889 RepID=UPI0036B9D4DA